MPARPRTPVATAAAAAASGRLFIALWPDDRVRQDLQAWQSAVGWPPQARLVPARDLHLTLAFIGAVPAARLADLAMLDLRSPALDVVLDTVEFWRGGLAVLAPSRVPPALASWHARLVQALRQRELPVDARPFRPHVTVARRSTGARWGADPALDPVVWPAAGGCLAARDGAQYRVQRRG